MKYRHIAAGLIVLSLIAVTFIATAAATLYYANMTAIKSGKDFTFTINTSTASTSDKSSTITSFGSYIDTGSLVITIFDTKGVGISIPVDWTRVSVSPDGNTVLVQLVKQDGLPSQSSAINIVGDLTGIYAGDTFFASGPGWGWGAHR